MIDLTVKVPEERVGEFYELLGRWLSGERLGDEDADVSAAAPKDWTNSEEDLALARVVWQRFSPRAQRFFSALMDQPERKVSGEALAKAANIPNGKSGVAGALGWPGRICKA